MMKKYVFAFLTVLLIGIFLTGCTGPSYNASSTGQEGPPPPVQPPLHKFPYIVPVFHNVRTFKVFRGSGTLVHSCKKHGTYVVTAGHILEDNPAGATWVYAETAREARTPGNQGDWYRTRVVYPDFSKVPLKDIFAALQNLTSKFESLKGKTSRQDIKQQIQHSMNQLDTVLWRLRSEVREGYGNEPLTQLNQFSPSLRKRIIHRLFQSRDFAVLKLRTGEHFKPSRISSIQSSTLRRGAKVVMAALYPEGYPHTHDFSWDEAVSSEMLQKGHSGAPIFYLGKFFAILTSYLKGTHFLADAPSVHTMRNIFKRYDLAFVLDPDPSCHSR